MVYLRGEITDDLATEVIAKLLFLEAGDPFKPITLKVDSPGGSVTAGLAIYDTMQQLKAHVRTHCEKEAGSMAAVLLASGSAGERSAARSCRVLLHELAFDDAGVRSTELLAFAKLKIKIVELLSHHTGRSPDEVWAQMRTAQSMDTAQAKAFGVIDEINR